MVRKPVKMIESKRSDLSLASSGKQVEYCVVVRDGNEYGQNAYQKAEKLGLWQKKMMK
jgi:hypothetical protein